MSLEKFTELLRRDMHPFAELEHWEEMTAAFLVFLGDRALTREAKREAFGILLRCSMGQLGEKHLVKLTHLTEQEALALAQAYVEIIRQSERMARGDANGGE